MFGGGRPSCGAVHRCPFARALGAVRRLAGDGHRRQQSRPDPRRNGRRYSRRARCAAPLRRADLALQSLLDLRLLADDRLFRPRHGPRKAGSRRRDNSHRRRRAQARALFDVRYAVRASQCRWRHASHRPPSHDERASHDADARGRHAPPYRRADQSIDRAARRPRYRGHGSGRQGGARTRAPAASRCTDDRHRR